VIRALLIAVFALVVGGLLGGCTGGPSVSAKVSGPTNGALVSDVRCVSQGGNITVTGTVTRNSLGGQANLVTYGGLKVFVYDSVGARSDPLLRDSDRWISRPKARCSASI